MKTLDFVFGMGFVGFLPISCTFHMVGGLLPGDKTSSGNKDENLELSAENSIISLWASVQADLGFQISREDLQIKYSILKNEYVSHSELKNFL